MLHPDDWNLFPARLLDEAADVRDDRVALVTPATTPFCTSTTRSAVFGRLWSVVMSPLSRDRGGDQRVGENPRVARRARRALDERLGLRAREDEHQLP